jgi:hypothetical protein
MRACNRSSFSALLKLFGEHDLADLLFNASMGMVQFCRFVNDPKAALRLQKFPKSQSQLFGRSQRPAQSFRPFDEELVASLFNQRIK